MSDEGCDPTYFLEWLTMENVIDLIHIYVGPVNEVEHDLLYFCIPVLSHMEVANLCVVC